MLNVTERLAGFSDYESIAGQLGIPVTTLRKKVSTWNNRAQTQAVRITPDYKEEHPSFTKFYFDPSTAARIKEIIRVMNTKRGRPRKTPKED